MDTVKLLITNQRTKIDGISIKDSRYLDEKLKFQVPKFFFIKRHTSTFWDGYIHFYNRISNSFNTGMLYLVVKCLIDLKLGIQVIDMRNSGGMMLVPEFDIEKCQLTGKDLRDYQIESVEQALTGTILDMPFIRGVINVATNGGKTVIAESILRMTLSLMSKDQRLLFLTHSLEIAMQTKKNIENDLGIPVGFIGNNKWSEEMVTVALIPTLKSFKSSGDKNPEKHKRFKLLETRTVGFIGDEIHHGKSETWYGLLTGFKNASIRIGLTGTLPESEIDKFKLFSITGPVITKISNQFLIDKGYSAKPICYYIPINDVEKDSLSYQDAYRELIVDSITRNSCLAKIAVKESENNNKVLILVDSIAHGENIQDILFYKFNTHNVFTNGKETMEFRQQVLKDLEEGDLKILISTSILDEGVDVSNINAVIYARGGKAPRRVLQSIGRGLRKKKDGSGLRFYDFIDYTNTYLLEHSLKRFTVVKGEGFEINKMELNDIWESELDDTIRNAGNC